MRNVARRKGDSKEVHPPPNTHKGKIFIITKENKKYQMPNEFVQLGKAKNGKMEKKKATIPNKIEHKNNNVSQMLAARGWLKK